MKAKTLSQAFFKNQIKFRTRENPSIQVAINYYGVATQTQAPKFQNIFSESITIFQESRTIFQTKIRLSSPIYYNIKW